MGAKLQSLAVRPASSFCTSAAFHEGFDDSCKGHSIITRIIHFGNNETKHATDGTTTYLNML
jgi:hypothetical protein